MKKKVCIIGAGASGLTALKHVLLSSRNSDPGNDANDGFHQLEGDLFEETDKIGGIWNYSEISGSLNGDDIKKLGGSTSTWTSPMYQGLRTNLPKEIMVFLDFPYDNYPATEQSYIKHSDVLDYLNKYTDHFGLRDFIKFNRRVIHVSRIEVDDENETKSKTRWIVQVQNTQNSQVHDYEYDSVIICNGHFNEPVKVKEEISSNFKGNLYHCQFYRVPELHKDEIVVVIGAGPSGTDIALELSKYAKIVYLSMKQSKPRVLNIDEIKNIQQICEITCAKENSVVLDDGQEIFCDTIIYCTGYLYNYPFLKDDTDTIQVKEGGKKVCPLFLQLIQPNYPSLAFIGLQFLVCPFLLFDCQSRFYIKYLEGKIKFTNQEMWKVIEESEVERISNGLDGRKSHQLSLYQWPYFEKLAGYGGFTQELKAIMPKIRELYDNAGHKRKNYPLTYRNECFT